MRVSNAFLANAAEVRDSLGYVLGAFPEWWTVPSLPALLVPHLVMALEYEDAGETTRTFEFRIDVRHPDGGTTAIIQAGVTRGMRPEVQSLDAPLYQVLEVPLQVQVRAPGRHEVTITSVTSENEKLEASIAVAVRVVPLPTFTDSKPPT